MKLFTLLVCAALGLGFSDPVNCKKGLVAAEDALNLVRKSQNGDWAEAKKDLDKALDLLDDVVDNTDDCGCAAANDAAEDAYKSAKKGYKGEDSAETRKHAKKAQEYTEKAITLLKNCQ